MNRTKRLIGMITLAVCGALPGYTSYGQSSVSVGVSVGLPSVTIRASSDFYEPLTPYGRWQVVGSYGRCWIPGQVQAGWRPYSQGYWQRSDAGWYWASDEPWAWATYHYGRWDLSPQFGWYWVPQTQWAPAWVSWHSGGGYVGWAPMYPSGVRVISPQAYVFVKQGRFLDPIRPTTVILNNTTIINKTVINEGPTTAVIEKASGRKIQAVPVQELRHKEEAAVVARQRTPASTSLPKAQAPFRSQAPVGTKTVVTRAPTQVEKATAASHESPAAAPKYSKAQSDLHNSAPVLAESRIAAKPETSHLAANKTPATLNANKQPVKQVKSAQPLENKAQRVSEQSKERPAASENTAPNTAEKNHENKAKE